MKKSKYNYILDHKDKSYWFNGITKCHFKLDKTLSNKLKNSYQNHFDAIEENAPGFYKSLVKYGFIIADDVNELELIREYNKKAQESKHYFLIIIPTLNCNFDCWYCVQDHVETIMSDATIEKVKKHIKYMVEIEKISSLHIDWFGGEPFMYFKEVIVPISEYASVICKNNGITFFHSATTNGFFLTSDIHLKISELNFERFQITLDGCRDLHNNVKKSKEGFSAFDITLNNINTLLDSSNKLTVLLRINYTNENLQNHILTEINEIISPENRSKINIMFRKVWQEEVDKTRAEKVYSLVNEFKSDGYCQNKHDINNTFLPCYADKKFYNAISYNGSVLKCTANDDLQSEDAPGKLNDDGSISWEEGFFENYFKTRYENKMCLECKNLPLCMGNCARDYKIETVDNVVCKANKEDGNFKELILHHIMDIED